MGWGRTRRCTSSETSGGLTWGGGETVATLRETEPRILNLPASLRNPRRFRFDTGISRIPSVIAPATCLFEKTVLEALYTWLNTEYSTGLAPPNLCRLGGELGPAASKGRVILIGASHTANIVAKADTRATHLLPRWKPATDVATLLASRLEASARRTQWCLTCSATPCSLGWSDLCLFWANQVLTCKGFLKIT